MAVTFEGESYEFKILAMCGVSPHLLENAKSVGVLVDYGASGSLTIKTPTKVYGIVPLKGTAITLLKEGKMGPASKESIKYQVEKCLNAAYQDSATSIVKEYGDAVQDLGVYPDDFDTPSPPKPKPVPKNLGELLKNNLLPPVSKFDPFIGKAKVPQSPQVVLKLATQLYQPVFGTSSGSVYYLVAMFQDLNLAIRRTSSSLSLRVEGAVSKYSKRLESVGFSVKSEYASVHLDVKDDALLLKTFGAVVGAIGFENLKQAGNPLEAK